MLFTSLTFAVFLLLVFLLYWFVFNRKLKSQNLFLLLTSYTFYGWWDWRFLLLLFFLTSSNYLIGLGIQKNDQKQKRRFFYLAGLVINIGTLILFKYFSFFIDGFINLISLFGFHANPINLSIFLPVGISFYIFLSISYLIDVYHRKLTTVSSFFEVSLSFSFFPIILAGPIQRPISLLPQIQNKRVFNSAVATDGLRQILWGVFMKVVIADRCAITVNTIFGESSGFPGSTLVIGIFLFTFQIYADFGGYSNIAIGIGKLLGFNIMRNFAYPYFARDIREFWQRWNISLTNWFRDYLFLPIAYSVSGSIKSDRILTLKTELFIYIFGITITWMLTGLWHGANLTFIVWGLFHGFFLTMNHIIAKPRKRLLKRIQIRTDNNLLVLADSLSTFIIVMFSWIFFRSESVGQALTYISGIFSSSILTFPHFYGMKAALITLLFVVCFIFIEWLGRDQEYAIANLGQKWYKPVRWAMYYCIILVIIYFSSKEQQFIYFQF